MHPDFTIHQIITISRVFDRVVSTATRDDLDALLFKLQCYGKKSTQKAARIAWVLARQGNVGDAVELLQRHPRSLLCRGYLERIRILQQSTNAEAAEAVDRILSALQEPLGTHLTDLEGQVHLTMALVMQLITLGRYEEAMRHVQTMLQDAQRLQMSSLVPSAEYQLSRILAARQDYPELLERSMSIIQHPDASRMAREVAADQVGMVCLYLGVPVPAGAPEWIRRALNCLYHGQSPGVIPSAEWSLVCESWTTLMDLTDLCHKEFPVIKSPRLLAEQAALLDRIMAVGQENINSFARTLIQVARTLGCAVAWDERTDAELQVLQNAKLEIPVLEVLRMFAVVQVGVYQGRKLVVPAWDHWEKCNATHRAFLSRFAADFAPAVSLSLSRFWEMPKTDRRIANVTDKGIFLGAERLVDGVRSYPIAATKAFFRGGCKEFSTSKVYEHAFYVERFKLHRVNFEMLSGTILELMQ